MPRRKGHGIPPTKRVKTDNGQHTSESLHQGNNNTGSVSNSDASTTASTTTLTINKLKRNTPASAANVTTTGTDGSGTGLQSATNKRMVVDSPSKVDGDEGAALPTNKYLHKKFKKMASTVLSPEEVMPPTIPTVNGSRVKGVLCSVPINNNNKNNNSNSNNSESIILDSSISDNNKSLKNLNDGTRSVESPSGRYTCPYCKLACAKPSVLQKHIRAHTNERPYPCTPCGFAFKTKSNLYKHCRSRAHTLKVEESGTEDVNDRYCSPPPGPPSLDDNAESSNEEDDKSTVQRSLHSSVVATIPDQIKTNCEVTAVVKEEKNVELHPKTALYKPKFHTTGIYLINKPVTLPNKEEGKGSSQKNHPNLLLKIPTPSTTTTVSPSTLVLSPQSTTSSFTSGSSPSPEFLQRHITKLISENQAIVETVWPSSSSAKQFWPKKYVQRSNSKEAPSSPLSSSPVPTDILVAKKYHLPRVPTSGGNEASTMILNQDFVSESEISKQNVPSKLALALLRPQTSVSPSQQSMMSGSADVLQVQNKPLNFADVLQQPLNLSTNNNNSCKRDSPPPAQAAVHSRKRSYSEGFPSAGNKYGSERSFDLLMQQNQKAGTNTQLNEEQTKFNSVLLDDISGSEGKHRFKNENMDYGSSIIKDLLLKTRMSGAVPSGMLDPAVTGSNIPYAVQHLSIANVAAIERISSRCEDQNQYICQYCSVPCRNAQNLEIHQHYYCKVISPVVSSTSSPSLPSINCSVSPSYFSSSKHISENKQTSAENVRKSSPMKDRRGDGSVPVSLVVSPPFPSPGPLLGNTPLVDNGYGGKVVDRIKQESSNKKCKIVETTSRTSPVPHHDQISKPLSITLRSLEELSKCPMRTNSLQMFGGEVKILDNPGGETKTLRIEPSNRSSSDVHVMDSAESPIDNSRQDDNHNEPSNFKESCPPQIVVTIAKTRLHSGGTLVQRPQKTTNIGESTEDHSAANNSSGMHQKQPPTVLTVNDSAKYPQTNKLIIPIIPNLPVPAVGIPFAPFTPILTDNNSHHGLSVINPLTSITGYNPLTLPAAGLISGNSNTNNNNNNSSNNSNNNNNSICSPYGGGIVTILHGGKPIPYVPGMPGPQTLISTSPLKAVSTVSSSVSESQTVINKPSSTGGSNTRKFSQTFQTEVDKVVNNKSGKRINSSTSVDQQLNDKTENSVSASNTSPVNKPVATSKQTAVSPLPVISIERVPLSESQTTENKPEKKFLRPTSLPLKPGTFIPKRHTLNTPTNVLPLVSPETPRPRKSYGQLYLNGHAYTYLGLKCSTRVFFCTLNKPQPIYVPLTPEHSSVSMYSNWKVCSDADPNPFGLDPGKAMRYYDSRHRPSCYTIAQTQNQCNQLTVTHSSYWINNNNNNNNSVNIKQTSASNLIKSSSLDTATPTTKSCRQEKEDVIGKIETEENTPKRVKIFAGGFESNEDYIYVRGRGRGRYVCEECGIRCKKPSMLKKHIRTHTDVRPFTCKHCTFSFKTKGNLTKHMKSKAHFKKCVELGLNPVPTLVDDSCINEEMLARQQAMRADQGLTDAEESEEEEEEEDDDDDDEEDEEEDDDNEDDADTWNSRLEREAAARSLLTLSEVAVSAAAVTVPPVHVQAGLVAIRPSTYPYSFTNTSSHASQPQTPTLTAMTAQREREKVSHNTRLARDLSYDEQQPTMCTAQKPSTHCESSDGASTVASRYYFPSIHYKSNDKKSALKKRTTESHLDERQSTADSENYDDGDDTGNLATNCSAEAIITKVSGSITETDADSDVSSTTAVSPIDLSNKTSDENRSSIINNNIRSQVQTCEAALLLASLCSTIDSLPTSKRTISNSHAVSDMMVDIAMHSTIEENHNNNLLKAYITERAVKQQTMKQQQQSLVCSTSNNNMSNTLHPVLDQNRGKLSITASSTTVPITSASKLLSVNQSLPSVSVGSAAIITASANKDDTCNETYSTINSAVTNDNSGCEIHSVAIAKENALDILIKTSTDAKKHALKLSNTPSGDNCVNTGSTVSPNKKLKAEFLPPSSGPSPSYVSVTEDGRSKCLICDKIFTKPSQLRLHVNIHYFERPFRCESCAVSFRTKGHLQKHQRSVTHLNKMSMNSTFGTATTTNPRPFKCDDCKIAFRIHGHLAKHLRSKMHIMKLECLGKLPFGTYAEMERSGINMNDIDTSDCENSLESLQLLAQKLYDKDPTKLGQWDQNEMMPVSSQNHRASAVTDHHGPTHLLYQQNQHQNEISSDDDELPVDINHHPAVSKGSITSTANSTSDDNLTDNKHYIPGTQYRLTSHLPSDIETLHPQAAAPPVMNPIHQNTTSTVKNKISNSCVELPSSSSAQTSSGSSSLEMHFIYLKKLPTQIQTSATATGIINCVIPTTQESGNYNKNQKLKSDKDQPQTVNATVSTTNVVSNTVVQYSNFTTTESSSSSSSSISSNNSNSESGNSRSVIQRIKCSFGQQNQTSNEMSSVNNSSNSSNLVCNDLGIYSGNSNSVSDNNSGISIGVSPTKKVSETKPTQQLTDNDRDMSTNAAERTEIHVDVTNNNDDKSVSSLQSSHESLENVGSGISISNLSTVEKCS